MREVSILAVDPGSKECGYALVESVGARVRFRSAGMFACTRHDADALLSSEPDVSIVGIERPGGFIHDPFRGPTMLATSWAAGGIAWLAEGHGLVVYNVSAEQGRKLVLGQARPSKFRAKKGDIDRLVKASLPAYVLGMPTKTNVHVRDALLLAVATNWLRLQPQRAPCPPTAQTAVTEPQPSARSTRSS